MFLSSESVKVFPLAKYRSEGSGDVMSRVFYEQNISNIIRQLIDTDGFIISGSVDVNANGQVTASNLLFNLYGYYFSINTGTILIDNLVLNELAKTASTVYAAAEIKLSEDEPKEIQGQDANSEYQGLAIHLTAQRLASTGTSKFLNLLIGTKVADKWEWKLDDKSYIKFSMKSMDFDRIDGKHDN